MRSCQINTSPEFTDDGTTAAVEKLIADVGRPWTLSVTPGDHRLLLASDGDQALYLHDSIDGRRIAVVSLPPGVDEPRHAVRTLTGTFVVSHGLRGTVHGLREVSADGRSLRAYGGLRGAGPEQVNYPVYLTVDQDGRIIAADRMNDRVLVFDARLELVRVLLTKDDDGVDGPQRLFHRRGTTELFVGMWTGASVNVFSVRYV